MAHKLITTPALAVSVDAVKLNSRIDSNLEDTWLNDAILSATELAEHITGRAFTHRTIEFALDAFPEAEIFLPVTPISSVVSIKYIDANGFEQTLNPASYIIDDYSFDNWILPVSDWPATSIGANVVKVRVVVGYGATESSVPASVKQWIKLAVDANYKHRGAVTDAKSFELPHNFCMGLLDPHKAYNL